MASPIVVTKIDQDKLVVTQANKLAEASYTMSLEEILLVLVADGSLQNLGVPLLGYLPEGLLIKGDAELFGEAKSVEMTLGDAPGLDGIGSLGREAIHLAVRAGDRGMPDIRFTVAAPV
jgi:hypothetical protein